MDHKVARGSAANYTDIKHKSCAARNCMFNTKITVAAAGRQNN